MHLLKIIFLLSILFGSSSYTTAHYDPFGDIVEIKSELTVEKNTLLFRDKVSLPLNNGRRTQEEVLNMTNEYYQNNYKIHHKNTLCEVTAKSVEKDSDHTITSGFFSCEQEILSLEELHISNFLFVDFPYKTWDLFLTLNHDDQKRELIFTEDTREFNGTNSEFIPVIGDDEEAESESEEEPLSVQEYENALEKEKQDNYLVIINKFIRLGIDHILDGVDHILFLIVLVLTTFRFTNILWLITGFTLSHSITIVLAGMGLISLTSKIVESIIALSIIYMAIANLVFYASGESTTKTTKKINKRILITFAFGLFHGLGFAGALSENAIIPENYLLTSLISFNIGVELGQILIIIVAFPILLLLKKHYDTFGKKILQLTSLLIAFVSIYWFFERVL